MIDPVAHRHHCPVTALSTEMQLLHLNVAGVDTIREISDTPVLKLHILVERTLVFRPVWAETALFPSVICLLHTIRVDQNRSFSARITEKVLTLSTTRRPLHHLLRDVLGESVCR